MKSGEIDPESLDAKVALEYLLSDHLLIRRPLIECMGKQLAGFDTDELSLLTACSGTIDQEGESEPFRCANDS